MAIITLVALPAGKSQTITIAGKITYSNWTMFAVNDTLTYEIHLENPYASNPRIGEYDYSSSAATLTANGNAYNFATNYAAGYSTLNYPRGNVTGMFINSTSSVSSISEIHFDIYSYYPNYPSITDDRGMILNGIPLSQILTRGWNVITDSVGGQYQFELTSYTFAKGAQAPLYLSSPLSVTFGSPYVATLTGGTGSGAVTWSLGTGSTALGAAIEPVSGAVTANSAGTVVINATKAADSYNLSATSADFTVAFSKAPAVIT